VDRQGATTTQTYTLKVGTDGTSTSTVYNGLGKATSITDQAGHTTQYEYDVLDRLTAVVDATNQRTEYKYDEMGHLIEQKDANGHITRYEYDGLGRPTATIRPMGQRSEMVYDTVGRVAKTTDFDGDIITYGYDIENRLIAKNFVSEGRTVAFTYKADGHRETVTDIRGVTRYEYDTQGQLLSRTEPDNTQISYTYDTQNQHVKSVTSLSGTTSYEYNALTQLTKVTGPDGKATTYTYDAIGNLSTTVRPNGTTQLYRYDALNRPVYLENKDQNGQILSSYTYTYDKVGNKLLVEEFGGRKVNYTYDTLNRLTKEAITDPVNGNRTIEYTYDVVGNRTSRNDSVEGLTTYAYDSNDRLLTETKAGVTTTYAYDRNGNLVSEQSLNKTVVYDWDSENHLMGAITSDATGTHQVQYLYDENGIRVVSIRDGVEVRYLVDKNRQYAEVLEEYSSTTGTIASYVHGNELVSQTRGSTTSYYLNDGHSGVRQLTDAAGVVTDSYAYDAFGEVIEKTGNTTNDYLYRGEQSDFSLGMQYLRARYYDQNTGRFVSTDPFEGVQENPASRHRYIYGSGNPITYSDPSGLFSFAEITAERVALNTLVGGIIQSFVGFALSKISGEPVQWTGWYANAVLDVNDTAAGGFGFKLTSDFDGYRTTGYWFVPVLGTVIGFPKEISATLGLPSPDGPPVTVQSPRIFGNNPFALVGYFNVIGIDLVPVVGVSNAAFTMGFGSGLGWNLTVGLSVGVSTLTGFSFPVFFQKDKVPTP
jgi:RHS repeat-associated protein